MKSILFVCTGNTCRSCMAEALLKKALSEQHMDLTKAFSITSCGISAYEGEPASHNSINVLKEEWNIDLSLHRAKRMTEMNLKEADLILTMTNSQYKFITQTYPRFSDKIFVFPDYAYNMSDNSDIADPYGGDLVTYKKCANQIKEAVDNLALRLRNYEL